MYILKFSLLILLSIIMVICENEKDVCPAPELIRPCTCNCETLELRCSSSNDIDLEQVFKSFVQSQKNGHDQWNTLELNLPILNEFRDNIFNGTNFKTIKLINCTKLNCVPPNTFTGVEKYVENFIAHQTSFAPIDRSGCNVFDALKPMKNLRSINITESRIREIPKNAFYESGTNAFHQLTHIDLNGAQKGEIAIIGKNAFSSLKSLKYVDFSDQQLFRIESGAFAFEEPSNHYLTINLENNPLKADSFESDSISVNGRITQIKLGVNPKLQVLKESIWKSFLLNNNRASENAQNIIELRGTPLSCSKQNIWLLENKFNLTKQIIHVTSADTGKSFWLHESDKC